MDGKTLKGPTRRKLVLENISWTLTIQGNLVSLKASLIDYLEQRGGIRSIITTFSRASRLRMLKMLSTFDWPAVKCGVFITLTLPDECWPCDQHARNKMRYLFLRDMEKHLGKNINALWRIEWKVRQSGSHKGFILPHFHLVIPGVKFVDKEWVRSTWKKCIHASGPVITWIESLDNAKKHAVYVSKYCAKLPASDVLDNAAYLNIRGRHWGVHRRELMPVHPVETFENLSHHAVARLRRIGCKCLPWYDPCYASGFSIFGKLGVLFIAEVRQLALDAGPVPL